MALPQLDDRAGVRRVAQRRRQRAALVEAQDFVEALELQARVAEVASVGVREVREDSLDAQVPAAKRLLEQGLRAVPVHADALHPRVDLEVDRRRATHPDGVLRSEERRVGKE